MNAKKGDKFWELKRVLKSGELHPQQQKMLDNVIYQIKTAQDSFVFGCLKELVPNLDMDAYLKNPQEIGAQLGFENSFTIDTSITENGEYLTKFLVNGNLYKTMCLNLSR